MRMKLLSSIRIAATLCSAGVAAYATPVNAGKHIAVTAEKPMQSVPSDFTQTGIASMYGDAKGLTTAHRTLPKGKKAASHQFKK